MSIGFFYSFGDSINTHTCISNICLRSKLIHTLVIFSSYIYTEKSCQILRLCFFSRYRILRKTLPSHKLSHNQSLQSWCNFTTRHLQPNHIIFFCYPHKQSPRVINKYPFTKNLCLCKIFYTLRSKTLTCISYQNEYIYLLNSYSSNMKITHTNQLNI